MLNGSVIGGLIPYFPHIQRTLHLSDSDLGLSLLFSPLGALVATPQLGRLIGRYGSRTLILATAFLLSVSTPLALLAPNIWLFRAALFLFGFMNSSQDVSMNAQAMVVQHRYPKPIISFTHGCWSIGGFAAGSGVALAARFGQSPLIHTVLVNAVILTLTLIGVRFLIPHEPDDVITEPAFVIPKGVVLTLGLLTMCAFAAEGAAYDWVAVFFRTVLGTSQSAAAGAFAWFGFAMAGGRFVGDGVVHRIGNKRTLVFGGLISAAAMVTAVSLRTPFACVLALVCSGLGLANVVPILFRAGGSVEGVASGTGVAAVTSCGYIAFLLSPPLIGLIADHASLSVALGAVGLSVLFVVGFGPAALRRTSLQ